jgi:membrane protein
LNPETLVLRRLWQEIKHDRLGDVAAMMTYFALFALFPMAIFVITVGLLVVPASAITQGVEMVTQAMPPQVGGLVREQALRMQEAAGGGFAVGSALLALWGASRGSVSLGRALNSVYNREDERPWWKVQLTGIVTTLVVAVLLVVALALLVAGPAVGHFLVDRFGLGATFDFLWSFARWLGAGLLVMVVWAILYKYLPGSDAPLKVFTPGAFAGVALWVGATALFGLYLQNFGQYEKTYGALGAIVIFLTWLYISNLALLLGAEMNDVIAERRKERGQPTGAQRAKS